MSQLLKQCMICAWITNSCQFSKEKHFTVFISCLNTYLMRINIGHENINDGNLYNSLTACTIV